MKKFTVIGVSFILVIVVCVLIWQHVRFPSDAEFSHQLAGAWHTNDKRQTMVYSPDGTFVFKNQNNTSAGMWHIKDGIVTATVTNDPSVPKFVGLVMRFRVIQMDGHHLEWALVSSPGIIQRYSR